MTNQNRERIYNPTPTALKFHQDNSLVRFLLGPVGCGKSLACCMEIFRIMAIQKPQADGKRRSRHVVIRETYPALKSTTLATWKGLFPTPETGRLVMSTPIVHYFKLGDIEAEVVFLSIETEDDIKKLMSLETTTVWINEARYSLREILRIALQRSGRYPSKEDGGSVQSCVFLDSNPCDDDHWLYRLFEEELPKDYARFKYPPALAKDDQGTWVPSKVGENIGNLTQGYNYYLNQANGNSEEWIKVYLCGEYGTSYDGRPVYPEYNDNIHCHSNLMPVKGVPLFIGIDFGMTPACVIGQLLINGQIIILDELCPEYIGLTNFITNQLNPFLSNYYAGYHVERMLGDPAGVAANAAADGKTSFAILADHGFPAFPASTNKIMSRKEAVSRRLSTMIDGQPALLISTRCKKLRKGFNGAYHFQKVNVAIGKNETKFKEEPNKNQYSHPHDALQYLCLNFDNFKKDTITTKEENNQMLADLGINISPSKRY